MHSSNKFIRNFKAKIVLITECFDPECGEKKKNQHNSLLDYRNQKTEDYWQYYRLIPGKLVSLVNDKQIKHLRRFSSIRC